MTIRLDVPDDNPLLLKAASDFFARAAACAQPPKTPLSADSVVVREAEEHTSGVEDGETSTPSKSLFPAADVRLDEKGVAFNEEYCGKAAKPFYASGPKSGQWKKKGGVDEAEYDTWYAGELPQVVTTGETILDVDTKGAFSGSTDTTEQSAPAPTTGGELMAWVSAKQVGGHLPQAMLDSAYAVTHVQIADLFNPPQDNPSVKTIYDYLSNQVGA